MYKKVTGWSHRVLLVLVLLALSACTVLGPDYKEPDVAWLEQWQPDLYGQVDGSVNAGSTENLGTKNPVPAQHPSQKPTHTASTDLRFWWRLFDDPVLDGLISTAKKENPGLRAAALAILESRAVLGIAGSALYPQLQQLSGSAAYVNTQQSGGVLDNDQSLVSFQSDLTVGWELDFWGAFKRGIESADAAYFAAIRNQQDVQVLLSAQVASLYYSYRTILLQIDISKRNAEIQKRSFDITQAKFTAGESSELDFQQAKTQYLATLATIPGQEIALAQTRNALSALLGRAPGPIPELANADQALPGVEPPVVQEFPAELLKRRPDIRVAAWQVAAQSAQIGIAEAQLYPAIALGGSLGWSANTLDGSSNTLTLGLGPGLSWNIFDHGAIRNNVRVQDARLQQAIEAFQNAVLQAAAEIDNAAISVVKTREQEAILEQSVTAAERALDLANSRYHEGYADFQRVLDAQQALFAQTSRQLDNQGNHIAAIIALYKSLGGGWSFTPIEQMLPEQTIKTMEARSNWGDLINAPLPTQPAATETQPKAPRHE